MNRLHIVAAVGGLGASAAVALAYVALREEPQSTEFSAPIVLFRPAQAPAPVLTERRYAPGDKTALIEDLQRQLQRVGCYRGAVNGVWTPATRSAMGEFNDRVNARLPIDQPDEFLLNLTASHDEVVCAAGDANALVTGTVQREAPAPVEASSAAVTEPVVAAPRPSPTEAVVPPALPAYAARAALTSSGGPRGDDPRPIASGDGANPPPPKRDLIADWLDNEKASARDKAVVDPAPRETSVTAPGSGTIKATEAAADASYEPERGAAPAAKKKARRAKVRRTAASKPSKFVRSLMRSVESAFSSLGLN